MNKHNTVRVRLPFAAVAAIGLTFIVNTPAALAAPVTVNFSATIFSASGDFTGVSGNVTGYFTYDSVPGTDFSSNPSIGLYIFSGAPYGFSVQINGFGTLDGTTTLAQAGDDGAVLPSFDVFQLAGNDGTYQAGISWTGPTSTFTGQGIPDIAVLLSMNPVFSVRNTLSGQHELIATIGNNISFAPVPLPPAVWLLATGLGLLAGIGRKAVEKD